MCIQEKMELAKKLQEAGWHLTEDGIKALTSALNLNSNDNLDPSKIIEEALNRDLRDIGGGALPNKREDNFAATTLAGRIVLQVQRVRNIAAPKSNEESKLAPRLLLLDLSDGQATLQALELEPVASLSLNVAPGTKIYFKAEKLPLLQGFLLLRSNDLQILGGRVEALYEKWDLARTMQKYARSGRPLSGSSAPPPWLAFGKSIDANADRNFKSLVPMGDKNKDKPAKENDEFNTMRSEAIAVASKTGSKKVFGGGSQNIVDHNIKKILDKGYSKDEAKIALQATRNNLERALFNLKRRKDAPASIIEPQIRGGRGERVGRERKRGTNLKDETEAAKPAANATLFDFLTTKLRTTDVAATESADDSGKTKPIGIATPTDNKATVKQYENNCKDMESKFQSFSDRSRFENNVSSSFAANRGAYSNRLSRGTGRGQFVRDERPIRGGGSGYTQRCGFGSVGNIRKHEINSHGKTTNRNGHDNPGQSISKSISEGKLEQESFVNKDQLNIKRNNERQSNRNGNPRPDNGSTNSSHNNRRRQQGIASGVAGGAVGGTASGVSVSRGTNAYNSNNEEFNTRLNKIVGDAANLKLSAPKRETRRGGSKQGGVQSSRQQSETQETSTRIQKSSQKASPTQKHQPLQQDNTKQHSNASYSQLPNGYTYDPSKIMGFQSKETNEFAMSLLKSQGLTIAQPNYTPTPTYSQPKIKQTFNVHSTPTTTHVQSNPQPVVISPEEQLGSVPGDIWVWKANDLCMAKYWDDGRYYEAEITAVSENTCVVLFLGYGNHEEVLKSDILPITDSQNRPLTNNTQSQHSQLSRCRTDRQAHQQQVYVPPHKREY